VLSCGLPVLCTHANRIVQSETLRPVRLRGVNRSGLEYASSEGAGFLANAGIAPREFDEIASWGANVVRIPFNQARALGEPALYLAALDAAIALAAARGMYTLLDLQWLDSETPRGYLADGRPNFVAPLPNLASLKLWSQLANRYKEEPAVLYDLFNEPHDPLPGDTGDLCGIRPDGNVIPLTRRRVKFANWAGWARQLVSVIRSENPGALIFVSGLDWGYDLHGFPLTGVPNVVYSSHVYPNKAKSWPAAFGSLSRKAPVFLGEWGGTEEHLAWGEELLVYTDDRAIGWTAWSWSDHPHLIDKNRASYEPTPFGQLVRASLRSMPLISW
jgi:endoglucanase